MKKILSIVLVLSIMLSAAFFATTTKAWENIPEDARKTIKEKNKKGAYGKLKTGTHDFGYQCFTFRADIDFPPDSSFVDAMHPKNVADYSVYAEFLDNKVILLKKRENNIANAKNTMDLLKKLLVNYKETSKVINLYCYSQEKNSWSPFVVKQQLCKISYLKQSYPKASGKNKNIKVTQKGGKTIVKWNNSLLSQLKQLKNKKKPYPIKSNKDYWDAVKNKSNLKRDYNNLTYQVKGDYLKACKFNISLYKGSKLVKKSTVSADKCYNKKSKGFKFTFTKNTNSGNYKVKVKLIINNKKIKSITHEQNIKQINKLKYYSNSRYVQEAYRKNGYAPYLAQVSVFDSKDSSTGVWRGEYCDCHCRFFETNGVCKFYTKQAVDQAKTMAIKKLPKNKVKHKTLSTISKKGF